MVIVMMTKHIRLFARCQEGALTAFGLLLTIAMICIGGFAVDVSNAVMVRTHLQVAADSAAHAALMARETESEADAKAIALNVARSALPPGKFGATLNASDIQFGQWNSGTEVFTPVSGSRDAVLVSTQRLFNRGNPMVTYFLRFVGLDSIDVVSQSVFETYYPTCYREGFVADERIDVQSNNIYRAGFCIHSQSHIEMNSNNTFENGVIVSMPNDADLIIPSSGWSSNPGLSAAVRSGSYHIRILQRINDIHDDYNNPSSQYHRPDYFNAGLTESLNPNQFLETSNWKPNHVHTATCNGNKRLRIKAGETIRNGVIDTSCKIDIGANATLENVLIISRNTDLRAVDGGSNVTLGDNDGCADGGGVQIITLGGVRFTAGLQMYGVQILAQDMIDFEANGNGVEGVSLVSGDEIDSTSNMDMGFCNGAGMNNNFEAEYFRMAR
ncbi:MAG: hypothetical protein HKN18_09485 [Silicimonas sp.]|nr:hypothetical protein [Silicimonas sp.]